MDSKDLKEFRCWKCNALLFLYKLKISIVIKCFKCQNENRARVGSGKDKQLTEDNQCQKANCTT